MNIRTSLISILGALALPAMGDSGLTYVPGEIGFTEHRMPASTTTRRQVTEELVKWNRNPVTADGWRQVDGEAGWRQVGTPSTTTRQQVQAELALWVRDPVTADGYKEVNGDAGWVYVGNRRPKAGESATISPTARAPSN